MDDLISEFITETTESISLLDSEMVKLEQNPEDAAILGNIFRIMHTINGTCRFLGLPRLELVAHASENLLGKIRDKHVQASADAVPLVLEALNTIKELIEHLNNHGNEPEGDDRDLIARLKYFAENGTMAKREVSGIKMLNPAPPAPIAKYTMDSAFSPYQYKNKNNGISMPTCLIVDDSKVVRTLEKRIMADLGYTISEAEDGKQAMQACSSDMPDLILLDWHMPEMNGLEFIKSLRAMPNGKTPKVVFCTTESELNNIIQALESGADEYIMKPFDAGIIRGKLQQIGVLEC